MDTATPHSVMGPYPSAPEFCQLTSAPAAHSARTLAASPAAAASYKPLLTDIAILRSRRRCDRKTIAAELAVTLFALKQRSRKPDAIAPGLQLPEEEATSDRSSGSCLPASEAMRHKEMRRPPSPRRRSAWQWACIFIALHFILGHALAHGRPRERPGPWADCPRAFALPSRLIPAATAARL